MSSRGTLRSGRSPKDGGDRVRLHLAAGHVLADRRRMEILLGRQRSADDDDLVAEELRLDPSLEHVDELTVGDRPGRPVVVDPGVAFLERLAPAVRSPSRRSPPRRSPARRSSGAGGVGRRPDRAPAARWRAGIPGWGRPRRRSSRPGRPSPSPRGRSLRSSETAPIRALSSTFVVGSVNWMSYAMTLGLAASDRADQLGVMASADRPRLVQRRERVGVDVDEDEVGRRRLGAADVEAGAQRVGLELAEDVRSVRQQGRAGHREADPEEQRRTKAPAALPSRHAPKPELVARKRQLCARGRPAIRGRSRVRLAPSRQLRKAPAQNDCAQGDHRRSENELHRPPIGLRGRRIEPRSGCGLGGQIRNGEGRVAPARAVRAAGSRRGSCRTRRR